MAIMKFQLTREGINSKFFASSVIRSPYGVPFKSEHVREAVHIREPMRGVFLVGTLTLLAAKILSPAKPSHSKNVKTNRHSKNILRS